MAGRGRGRGTGRTMLLEQLGVDKSEMTTIIQETPPEIYPPLLFLPVPLPKVENISQSYMLLVKKEFRDYLQNSEYFIQLDAVKSDVERFSDRYHSTINKNKLSLCWSRFPSELHPQSGKKRKKKVASKQPNVLKSSKKLKAIDITAKLDELERKETDLVDDDEVEDADDEETEVIEEAEDDVDEEMDEGTDYINSYFDNGEDYGMEDDDALEEGGVF